MRIRYVLWGVSAAIWIVLAVLSDDPVMKWVFAVAATLALAGPIVARWEQRKKNARDPEGSSNP